MNPLEGLLTARAKRYAVSMMTAGGPLDTCVDVMDCTKIKIRRPRGHGSLQRDSYSGQNRMHCLICQTITTRDGLIFSLYGPEVGRKHGVTL